MAVVGPSGVGKSSFVRAGLVPALKTAGEAVGDAGAASGPRIRSRRSPASAGALVAHLHQSQGRLDHRAALAVGARSRGALRAVTRRAWATWAALRARARQGEHLLLFVDQFEELYTLATEEERAAAFTRASPAWPTTPTSPRARRGRHALGLPRPDRRGPALHDRAVQGLFFLPRDRDGLREALVQPAERRRPLRERPAMVDDMLDTSSPPPARCRCCSSRRPSCGRRATPRRKLLTEASYRAIGGIAGALASHADAVSSEHDLARQATRPQRAAALVTPERTRAVRSMGELRELSADSGAMDRVLGQPGPGAPAHGRGRRRRGRDGR